MDKQKKLKELEDKQNAEKEKKEAVLQKRGYEAADFIIKESSEPKASDKKDDEKFVPDFDPDEVPPLE